MRKHLSYYFWRVAVGVTIGLIMLLFSNPEAFALSWNLDYVGEKAIFDNTPIPFTNIGSSEYNSVTFDHAFTNSSGVNFAVLPYSATIFGNNPSNYSVFDLIYRVSLYSDNGAWSSCEIQTNRFVCPLIKNNHYTAVRFYFAKDTELTSVYIKIRLDTTISYWNYYQSSSSSQISSNTNETAQNTKETNDLIKSDDIGDDSGHSSTFASWQNSSAQNGTITNLITLPITLYTSILNNINGSCSSFSLGSLYGSSLTLTCIQPSQYLGTTLWGVIDMLFSGFFIFIISKKMIKVFNNMSMLKEGDILD